MPSLRGCVVAGLMALACGGTDDQSIFGASGAPVEAVAGAAGGAVVSEGGSGGAGAPSAAGSAASGAPGAGTGGREPESVAGAGGSASGGGAAGAASAGGTGGGSAGAQQGGGGGALAGEAGAGGKPTAGGSGGGAGQNGDPLTPKPAANCPGYVDVWVPLNTCIYVHGSKFTMQSAACDGIDPPERACGVVTSTPENGAHYTRLSEGAQFDRIEVAPNTNFCPKSCSN